MPEPCKANTAVATSKHFPIMASNSHKHRDRSGSTSSLSIKLNNRKGKIDDKSIDDDEEEEEDWEMISEKERRQGSGVGKFYPENSTSSQAGSSFESIHAPNSVGVRSYGSNSLLTPVTPGPGLSTSSNRSFNSALLKDIATLAVHSNFGDADEISSIASVPSIRSNYGNEVQSKNGVDESTSSGSSTNHSIEAYVEHVVLPSDTLQGLCLSYKISASKIRQVNRFSGNSLVAAPKKLIIPLTRRNVAVGIKQQDQNSKEYKIYYLISECSRKLDKKQAQHFLEKNNWIVEKAVHEANNSDTSILHEAQTPKRRGDGLSFEIAIMGNIAFPTKFISPFNKGKKNNDLLLPQLPESPEVPEGSSKKIDELDTKNERSMDEKIKLGSLFPNVA